MDPPSPRWMSDDEVDECLHFLYESEENEAGQDRAEGNDAQPSNIRSRSHAEASNAQPSNTGDDTFNIRGFLEAELDKFEESGFLKKSFIKKAKEATSLKNKGDFVQEIISDFIEDREAAFARLSVCIEIERKFKYIIKALAAIKKASKRIGAQHLFAIVSSYEEKYEHHTRLRDSLSSDYDNMKKEFDKLKNQFKFSLLPYAKMAISSTAPPTTDLSK